MPHFWPSSESLSETGAAPAPNGGGGAPGGGGFGPQFGGGFAGPTNAGEIMLSRAESAALAALETEPHAPHALKRAQLESGLTKQQVTALKRRAEHALSKGITLKGPGFIRKPTQADPDTPGLLRGEPDADEGTTKKAAVKKTTTTVAKSTSEAFTEMLQTQQEAVETFRRRQGSPLYETPHVSRLPVPHSLGEPDDIDSVHLLHHGMQLPRQAMPGEVEEAQEANAESTLARLAAANKRRKKKQPPVSTNTGYY